MHTTTANVLAVAHDAAWQARYNEGRDIFVALVILVGAIAAWAIGRFVSNRRSNALYRAEQAHVSDTGDFGYSDI